MSALQLEFTLTHHARQRISERFPLAMTEVNSVPKNQQHRKMYEFLWNATVENRVVNDTLFMKYLYEQYGFDKSFKFFANKDMLFIGVISDGIKNIVTVVNRDTCAIPHLRPSAIKLQKKLDTYHKKPR